MLLVAWRNADAWTKWHLDHLGQPLCGLRIPEKPIATAHKPAKPSDWAKTCESCREIALRAATGPVDIYAAPRPTATHLTLMRDNG